uniref:DUF4794 domain-containing protein n=1 Tax=Glossina palpalis gambiensis TaxID=67801 RepID=A0A1B0APC5_9MUSC
MCYIAFCLNVLIYAVTARVTEQASDYINPAPDSNELATYNPKDHKYGELQHSTVAHYPSVIETITPYINLVSFSIPRLGPSNLNYYAADQGLNAEISPAEIAHPEQSYNLQLLTAPFPGYQENNRYYHSIPVHQSILPPIKQTYDRINNLQKFLPQPESLQNTQQIVKVSSVHNDEPPSTLVHEGMKTLTSKILSSIRPAFKSESSNNNQFPNLAAVASSASPYQQHVYTAPFSGSNREIKIALEASDVPKQAISSHYKIEHLRSSPSTYLVNVGSTERIHDANAFTQLQRIQLISDDAMQQIHNKLTIASPRKQIDHRTIANTPVAQSSKTPAPLQKTFHLPLSVPAKPAVKYANFGPFLPFSKFNQIF